MADAICEKCGRSHEPWPTPTFEPECAICGKRHVARDLSCNESRLVYDLAEGLFDAHRERDHGVSTYECIAVYVRRNRL